MLQFTLPDANVMGVVRICQQLDGIPLAIEIAAAQARVLPIEAIVERLDQRFAWQNKPAGESASRQRTLHTLIGWSFGLLSAQGRSVLRRFSVFAGGWTLEAAEAVSTPSEPCADLLAELVDHSLVVFGADAGRPRYGMHETTMRNSYPARRRIGQGNHSRSGCGPSWMTTITSAARSNGCLLTITSRRLD